MQRRVRAVTNRDGDPIRSRAWAVDVLRRLAIRISSRRRERHHVPDIESAIEAHDAHAPADELIEEVARTFPGTEPFMRLAVEGYSNTEIATRLGVSTRTVQRRLRLAKKEILDLLNR